MADDKDDVHRTLAYGFERFLIRQIPLAAFLLLAGIGAQVWPTREWNTYFGAVLAAASFAYIVFACWRRYVDPGRPRLVLSTEGIDQRLSHGRILHIPWHEVQGVVSIDHLVMNVVGFSQTTRDVPAVEVSPEFYEQVMPHKPWLRRSLDWGHFAEARNGMVQILFRHDYLGARAQDLRQAIEIRWRAFSRHPNAKLPQCEELTGVRRRAGFLPSWMPRWTLPAILVLCALPALYFYWAFVWLAPEVPEGTRSAYLGDLLDKGGVTARLADGRMTRLRRADVAAVGIPQCDPETTRDPATSWTPVYFTAASCTARLTLPSGAQAVAVFRLVKETFTVEYKLGEFREQSALVVAPLSLEEADALLCRLGYCGPDMHKR